MIKLNLYSESGPLPVCENCHFRVARYIKKSGKMICRCCKKAGKK